MKVAKATSIIFSLALRHYIILMIAGLCDICGAETTSTSASTSTATDASSPTSTDTEPDVFEVAILDSTGDMQLHPGLDGSLFLSSIDDSATITPLIPGTSQFLAERTSLSISNDASNDTRFLYYYPAEMSAVSVSRLRLGVWGAIPLGAQLISLIPFDSGDNQQMLVALDTMGNHFWLVLCGFVNLMNKVFLAKNITEGPTILQSNDDIRYIITGGDATQCGPLLLVAPGLQGFYGADGVIQMTSAPNTTAQAGA